MRKLYYLFLLFIPILLLSGCYESEIPLSEGPVSEINTRLINSWKSIPDEPTEDIISLMVWKFNDNEYLLSWKESMDDEAIIARGFDTRINETNMINLQDIKSFEENDRVYVFFKYLFNEKGNLLVNILSNDYHKLKGKKFRSSKEFHDFIQENIEDEGLFGDSIEFESTDELNFEIKSG